MILRFSTILLSLFFSSAVLAVIVHDDAGRTIQLDKPAQRIISLAPDMTEILFAAGAGAHIVGVMRGSDYPAEAKKIPQVASFNSVDTEKILALHPDLIIVWAEGGLSQQLTKLGIPVFQSHQRKLLDIPATVRRLGQLAGTQMPAELAAKQFEQRYRELERRYSHYPTITVFYEVWPRPLMTITQASWIDDVITLCGGKNIFATLKGAAPIVSLEAVLALNPQVIFGPIRDLDWKEEWQKWKSVPAVKNNQLVRIQSDWLERAGPRILLGAAEVCGALEKVREQSKAPLTRPTRRPLPHFPDPQRSEKAA